MSSILAGVLIYSEVIALFNGYSLEKLRACYPSSGGIIEYLSQSHGLLNEVNYLAFREINEKYHNELYGHIKGKKIFDKYEKRKLKRNYIRVKNAKPDESEKIHSPSNPSP